MFPLILNLTNRLAVVVGGGSVGRRKASAVLSAGGRVRLLCLEPRPANMDNSHLDWIKEAYAPHHLDGASLVFAAAPADVNARVVADARTRGLWVNAASEPSEGDFFLPAIVRRGDFLLAISTGGAAPLLAQTVRTRLETEFDAAFGVWVELLAELRPQVMERIADAEARKLVLTRLCQWEWLERLRREDANAVRTAMHATIEDVRRGLFPTKDGIQHPTAARVFP
jgi:precorrin-2 dehydrogenase/sirohydrochlorin ferrochelatase